jgi:hypothetical protein
MMETVTVLVYVPANAFDGTATEIVPLTAIVPSPVALAALRYLTKARPPPRS